MITDVNSNKASTSRRESVGLVHVEEKQADTVMEPNSIQTKHDGKI